MSPVNAGRSYQQLFTIIRCPCGRELRVKRALVGTEVRCWDCHQMVLVPIPRTTGIVALAMVRGLNEFAWREVVVATAVASAIVTGFLMVDNLVRPIGVASTAILVAAVYGELIRRTGSATADANRDADGEDNEREEQAGRPAVTWIAFRAVVAVVAGLILTATWLSPKRDFLHTPRLTPPTLAVAIAGCIILPLAMLIANACDKGRPLGPRRVLGAVARHPLWFALSLLLLPLAIIIAEVTILALLSFLGWMPFFVLELFPNPQAVCERFGVPYIADHFIGGLPDPKFGQIYAMRLGQGYSLLAAIPYSLPMYRFPSGFPWGVPVLTFAYLAQRVLYTQLMFWIITFILVAEVRLLALIPAADAEAEHYVHPDAS